MVAPTNARCAVSVQASAATIGSGGGTGAIAVETARECQWTATAEVPWLTLMSSTSGQGAGSLPFSAAPNRTTATRVGGIAVNGQRVEIAQEAGTCDISVAPTTLSTGAAGGDLQVAVTTQEFCTWTAVSRASWIVIVSSGNGTGTSEVTIRATANTGPARTGTIDIGGRSVVVSQDAAAQGCTYAIASSTLSASAAGQSASVAVTATANCPWAAISEDAWIAVRDGAAGTGDGSVTLEVLSNSGAARTGRVTIAGRTFTVTQAAALTTCTYSVSPAGATAAASGTTTTVAVAAGGGCSWSAVSDSAWITVTGTAGGTGSGTVTLAVAANPGGARSGVVTIAGQPFTISQSAGTAPLCTYAVSPGSVTPPATGGPSTLTVTAGAGCAWALAGAPSWITVSSGTGSGNGTINLTVSPNTGAARTATLTVAGQSIAVTQAAAGTTCTYALNPTSLSPTAAGGSTAVAVTTAAGCTWTTSGAPAWITVTGGSGTGNGSVTLAVALNTGPARTATLTIAGQAFAVTQAAGGTTCTYAINPTSVSPTAAGGSTTVAVTTAAGCAWTTSGAPAWITVTGGSGTGNGSVTVAVAANTGAARSATLTIAGQSFTVTQAAACTYSINPTTFNPTAAAGSTAVAVTTTAACTWTTSGAPTWVTVTGGSGTGNGSVTVAVQANTGGARTATLTIAGQPFVVNQAAAACSFTVAPTPIQVSDANTTRTVDVTTASHCSWTAAVTSGASWLTISPASDTGSGPVDISIARNFGSARTGTLLVAGKVVTVNQAERD